MCVMSLLSEEKKQWLKHRVELYGHSLKLDGDLSQQVKTLPNQILEQLSIDVSICEARGYQHWSNANLADFKHKLESVRTKEITPMSFQKMLVSLTKSQC